MKYRPHSRNGRIGWWQKMMLSRMENGETITESKMGLRGKARNWSSRYCSSLTNIVNANADRFERGNFGPRGGYGWRKIR